MEHHPTFHNHYPQPLQDWVHAKGWDRFREIQKLAFDAVPIDPTATLNDLILEAETSSGKTEAAFLPLLARYHLSDPKPKGFAIVYISPLKALINDAQSRLATVAASVGLEVYRWHSDSETDKTAARKASGGVLLTTPESIEGFLVRGNRKPSDLAALIAAQAIVVDELHAYFDTARGRHLQSLLHRLDLRAGGPIPRIGLSATLGGIDYEAAQTLRPKATTRSIVLRSTGGEARPVKVGVKVFVDEPEPSAGSKEPARKALPDRIAAELVSDLGSVSRALVFANARGVVETTFERLNMLVTPDGPFSVAHHHSSVPKKEREDIEKKMRSELGPDGPPEPMVVICTNTLELGIDIGRVERVIQIEPTFSVAALRQRVGRSGRRDDTNAEGIVYVMENALAETTHPLEQLRLRTVQATATAQLSLEAAFEAPNLRELHLSTLYHQILSLLFEHGECTTKDLHEALVLKGPWEDRGPLGETPFFERFLETMEEVRKPQIARGAKEGCWRLAQEVTERKHAYAVFSTPAEYVVTHGANVIGRLPATVAYRVGDTFVLSAGRWRVTAINDARHTLTVARAPSAGAPRYGGPAQTPSRLVTTRIREILNGKATGDLAMNDQVERVIEEGRAAFRRYNLDSNHFLRSGRETLVFPWTGAKLTETLVLALRREGLKATTTSFAITVEDAVSEDIKTALKTVSATDLDLEELAREARQLQQDKFDRHLIPYHLRLGYARRSLTTDGLPQVIESLLNSGESLAA